MISPSVARLKAVASRMPYGSQSSTEDISRCIVVSIEDGSTLANVSSGGESLLDDGIAARACLAGVVERSFGGHFLCPA